jgi:hypothetical protein
VVESKWRGESREMRAQLTEHAQQLLDWPRNDVENAYDTQNCRCAKSWVMKTRVSFVCVYKIHIDYHHCRNTVRNPLTYFEILFYRQSTSPENVQRRMMHYDMYAREVK